MKAIVFGGSGFLGSHVCDILTEAGHEVSLFDWTESKWLHEGQKMIVGDILNESDVNNAIESADIVYNFAGIADIDEAISKPIDTVKYNILGNTIILEGCRKHSVKRYIFASSVYVYSQSGSFYRCSKQACESYIENYYYQYGLEYTILRYGSLYGSRSDNRNAIYSYIAQAINDNKIKYNGSHNSLREYIHVEDAALCSLKILEPEYANKNIILTGHQSMRISDLFKMISEILRKEIKIEYNVDSETLHYEITPYSYNPKIGKKMTLPLHIDLGQGLLKIIEELS